MSNEEFLQEYSNAINNLKKQYKDNGMTEDEFKRIYFKSLKSLQSSTEYEEADRSRRLVIKYGILFIGTIIVLYSVYNFETLYSTIMCNVQEFIYPGLKLLRRISIPIISLFPSLTGKLSMDHR